MSRNTWPNFLILGAGKSGTTSLDYYLNQHPDIYMSPRKEPNFFGFETKSEADFIGNPTELEYYRQSVTDKSAYLSLFSDVNKETAIGEISNTYLYHESACERIKHWIPNVKLIAIFRQPVDRLYSRYLHLARDNRLPTQNFEDCLDRNTIWWKRNDLIQEGFYYRHLSKFYDSFPLESIKIFLYEDLKSNSDTLMKDLFNFLEVDASFKPNTTVKYNSSGFVKNQSYERFLGHDGFVKRSIEKLLPRKIFDSLKRNQIIQKSLTRVRERNLSKPKLSHEMKSRLLDIYRDDIDNLSKLIDRDLTHWLEPSK